MDITSSTAIAALITGWVGQAGLFALAALGAVLAFAMGYAVAKGAIRFILKRLHLLS